jgi:hypothetical protein
MTKPEDAPTAAVGSPFERPVGRPEPERAHPSARPFKCPVCGSHYFGPIFEKQEHVGRYCKGWPSGHDRSYIPCRGRHEERFETPNAS